MRRLSQIIYEAEKDQRKKKQEAQNTIDLALWRWAKDFNEKYDKKAEAERAHVPGTEEFRKRTSRLAEEIILMGYANSVEGKAWLKERMKKNGNEKKDKEVK